ncbi:Ankyrin repeat protein 2 [Giardia muris]|uniref:Ankyrin repeat protein 2 n=1 Tax=Giardia muris TaxID=5742 RepID=A0A4Z1SRN8_GIAMU|nr:Ankyrin repeat protein 2 [Giardia muris]|eukprot:TNJ27645.1 Ankyrin repeat protein 2 [Giardia muris]
MSALLLIRAAERGEAAEVQRYLSLVGQRDENGWTALMYAAQNGHLTVLKLLLEHEATQRDGSGWTALMYAAMNGHLECAQMLSPHEAGLQSTQVEWEMQAGASALMIAARWGHLPIVQLLRPQEAGLVDAQGHDAMWYARYAAVDSGSGDPVPEGHPDLLRFLEETDGNSYLKSSRSAVKLEGGVGTLTRAKSSVVALTETFDDDLLLSSLPKLGGEHSGTSLPGVRAPKAFADEDATRLPDPSVVDPPDKQAEEDHGLTASLDPASIINPLRTSIFEESVSLERSVIFGITTTPTQSAIGRLRADLTSESRDASSLRRSQPTARQHSLERARRWKGCEVISFTGYTLPVHGQNYWARLAALPSVSTATGSSGHKVPGPHPSCVSTFAFPVAHYTFDKVVYCTHEDPQPPNEDDFFFSYVLKNYQPPTDPAAFLVEVQSGRCPGCSAEMATVQGAVFCHYTGRFYCPKCSLVRKTHEIPGKIIVPAATRCYDKFSVSARSFQLLETHWRKANIPTAALLQARFDADKSFSKYLRQRVHLSACLAKAEGCKTLQSLLPADSVKAYYYTQAKLPDGSTPLMWSMADLVSIHRGRHRDLDQLYARVAEHTAACTACGVALV